MRADQNSALWDLSYRLGKLERKESRKESLDPASDGNFWKGQLITTLATPHLVNIIAKMAREDIARGVYPLHYGPIVCELARRHQSWLQTSRMT